MMSMVIVFLWARVGRIICANSVQRLLCCFAQSLHKLWPGFCAKVVQTLARAIRACYRLCWRCSPAHAIQTRQRATWRGQAAGGRDGWKISKESF